MSRQRLSLRTWRVSALFALAIMIGLSTLYSPKASAAIMDPAMNNIGYFTRANIYYNGMADSRVMRGGLYANSVDSMMNRLISAYNGGGQDAAGSAFLVHTMLGRGFYNPGGPSVSSGDWTEVRNRLNALQAQNKINWNAYIYTVGTTYGSDKFAQHDVAGHSAWAQNGEAIVIDVGGGATYTIFKYCANPTGNSNPLPVAINFDLTPSITATPPTLEGKGSVTLTPTIRNSGVTDSTTAQWRITTYRITPAGATVDQRTIDSGTGSRTFPRNATTTITGIPRQNLPEYEGGTQICFVLSVTPVRHDNGGTRQSTPACVSYVKKPKVNVLGGDVLVGRGANGSQANSNIRTSMTFHTETSDTTGFDPSMITGFYGTGTDASGNPRNVNNQAAPDLHWRVASIEPGTSGLAPCQGAAGNAFLIVSNTYNGRSSPRGSGWSNPQAAWLLDPTGARGAWIGANPVAMTSYYKDTNPSATCTYPANFSTQGSFPMTINGRSYNSGRAAFTALAPVWTFQMNDFFVNSTPTCTIDTNSIQFSFRMSADDEAEVFVNDVLVASRMDNRNRAVQSDTSGLKDYARWPSSLVNVTTKKVTGAFRQGANTLKIKVKSNSSATGLVVAGGAVASGDCMQRTTTDVYGSWGEYALAAVGTITNMASGAGYSNGIRTNTVPAAFPFCSVSTLTFAGGGGTGCAETTAKGLYSTTRGQPAVDSKFTGAQSWGANPTRNISSVAGGVYSGTGTISISQTAAMPAGKSVIINAPGATVRITGNLTYTNAALTSISSIPQLVIIADRIIINSGVTQVDAWLVARGANGTITTCDSVTRATDLNTGTCSNVLTVNGPVMANKLYLWRTAGAGSGARSGEPAEIFNLRPDAYLWATNYQSGTGRLQTVNTKELPPRF